MGAWTLNNFYKMDLMPTYTKFLRFRGEHASKKAIFLSKLSQNCVKMSFLTRLSIVCVRRNKSWGQSRVFMLIEERSDNQFV